MKFRLLRRTFPALVLAAAVPAASQAVEVRPLFKAGVDFGGDNIVTATFTDGSTDSIKANDGLYVAGGALIGTGLQGVEVEVSAGYKYSGITAGNGDITWTRFPLEALVFYRFPQFRVGGGPTYHLNPKLKGSGVVGGLNVNVDDALGVVLQGDYLLWKGRITLGGRYTILDYKANGVSAKSNGIGISFGMSF
ncbi:MAG: outer membrane beta-barrel protein [Burkholderiales bacterium]